MASPQEAGAVGISGKELGDGGWNLDLMPRSKEPEL